MIKDKEALEAEIRDEKAALLKMADEATTPTEINLLVCHQLSVITAQNDYIIAILAAIEYKMGRV